MARPFRIEYPGASYHVVNRGNQRQKVFYSSSHYELFLEKLGESCVKFNVTVRCYCLMPNHFHLYLNTAEANLGRFMQTFLTSFCYSLNRIRGKSGHIFQGRFKSHVADDEAYGMAVSRYIHLNPVRINSLEDFDMKGKIRCLDNFNHSSYRFYVDGGKVPEWLDISHVLSKLEGRTLAERRTGYRNYVEEGISKTIESPFNHVSSQAILGDEHFVERIKRSYAMNLNLTDMREQKELSRLRSSFDFDEILKIVSAVSKVGGKDILRRRSEYSLERKMLMYCADKYCRSRMSLSDLAERMSVSQSGLARSKGRFETELVGNKSLRRRLDEIENMLSQ